jgi:diadenosine tetraphosphate (Ap4A) HIT family hydrolase
MKSTTRIFETIPDSIEDSSAPWTTLVREDLHVAIYEDRYPCTPGHLLFVPKYNTMAVLLDAFNDAVMYGQTMIENGQCDGFNVGMNYGTAAGQTVEWPHVHLIPRRHGDVEDPVGGVRNTIPGRGNYRKYT